MKFNHLNVPEHWQQYWSRYPEGYTILEALISWVSQVDKMTDNVNEWNLYLDEFVATFDTTLQNTVKVILDDWNETGFLQNLINEMTNERLDDMEITLDNVDTRVTNMGNNKVDKGGNEQVTMPMLGPDIKQAINSGVWNVNINTSDIEDNSVTFSKQTPLGHSAVHFTSGQLPDFDFTNNVLIFTGLNTVIMGNEQVNIGAPNVSIPPEVGSYFLVYNTITLTTEFVAFNALVDEHIVFGGIRNTTLRRYVNFFNGQYRVNGSDQRQPIYQWAAFYSSGGYIDFDFDNEKVTIPSLGVIIHGNDTQTIASEDIIIDMDTISTTMLVYNVQTKKVEIVPYNGVGYEHYILAIIRYSTKSVWTIGGFNINGKLFGIDTTPQTTTEQSYTDNLMQIFPDYTSVGDSLTAGYTSVGGVTTGSETTVGTKNNYPGYLELRTGRPFTNVAVGGSTSGDWRTTHIQTASTPSSAYTVGLGVNDARQGITVGTPADIVETHANNANTFYGNYDFVIRELQSYNSKAHIFVFTIPPHETNAETYNPAIRHIAGLYNNVHLIDLYNIYYEEYTTGFLANNYVNGHYTPVGYNYISTMIEKAINQYIFENGTLFQSVPYS